MQKETRKQMVLRRKNFLPTLVITFILLITLVSIVYFVDPRQSLFIFIFFINLFAFTFFLFSLIFTSSKKGLIVSVCLTIFAVFRFFGIGNILNAILISGLGIIALIYAQQLTKRN